MPVDAVCEPLEHCFGPAAFIIGKRGVEVVVKQRNLARVIEGPPVGEPEYALPEVQHDRILDDVPVRRADPGLPDLDGLLGQFVQRAGRRVESRRLEQGRVVDPDVEVGVVRQPVAFAAVGHGREVVGEEIRHRRRRVGIGGQEVVAGTQPAGLDPFREVVIADVAAFHGRSAHVQCHHLVVVVARHRVVVYPNTSLALEVVEVLPDQVRFVHPSLEDDAGRRRRAAAGRQAQARGGRRLQECAARHHAHAGQRSVSGSWMGSPQAEHGPRGCSSGRVRVPCLYSMVRQTVSPSFAE